jgi:hypothetical protein
MAIPQWQAERVCGASACPKRFTPKRRGQKYCSDECRYRAWNEERVSIRIDSNAIKARSLKPNEKNMAVRTMRYFRDLPTESRKIVMQWCADEGKMAKQKARESSRLEKYIEAEHWRAVTVFTERLKQLLSR